MLYCWADSFYPPGVLSLQSPTKIIYYPLYLHMHIIIFPTGCFLPLCYTNSSFSKLWPSPEPWIWLRLLPWLGRLLCMDCRKLHFGMIRIEIMKTCIHALLQVSWLLQSLQVVFLVLGNVPDNWQCYQTLWRFYDSYVFAFRRDKVVFVALTCHKGSVCVHTQACTPRCMYTRKQRAEQNLFWWKYNNGENGVIGNN